MRCGRRLQDRQDCQRLWLLRTSLNCVSCENAYRLPGEHRCIVICIIFNSRWLNCKLWRFWVHANTVYSLTRQNLITKSTQQQVSQMVLNFLSLSHKRSICTKKKQQIARRYVSLQDKFVRLFISCMGGRVSWRKRTGPSGHPCLWSKAGNPRLLRSHSSELPGSRRCPRCSCTRKGSHGHTGNTYGKKGQGSKKLRKELKYGRNSMTLMIRRYKEPPVTQYSLLAAGWVSSKGLIGIGAQARGCVLRIFRFRLCLRVCFRL